jgi:hypothetical protein
MSAPSRREKIEAMLQKDPKDQFLRYQLAMELEKVDQHEESLALFRGLMADAPAHVPSFLMAAQHLTKLDRIDEARGILRQGIEEARKQANSHAAGEMSELLASLGSAGA